MIGVLKKSNTCLKPPGLFTIPGGSLKHISFFSQIPDTRRFLFDFESFQKHPDPAFLRFG
jgi:hypothetical protein